MTQFKEHLKNNVTPKVLARIGIAISQRAKELVPKDTGGLRDSIDYAVEGNTVHIGTNHSIAPIMEYGRRPGTMPPVEPIENWARIHGMEGAGWPIAVKIKKEGIKVGTKEKPLATKSGYRPFLSVAMFQSKAKIKEIIKEASA